MSKPKLRVVTLFSGIGAQERGIRETGLFDIEVVATSDIDRQAILSYASMHCDLTERLNEYTYPSRADMVKELQDKNIGYKPDSGEAYDWWKVERKKDKTELEKYWLAVHLMQNEGDIRRIKALPECDLMVFSFPCTDISSSGKQRGLSYADWKAGLSTRSGLVWEVVRLLRNYADRGCLPAYLLMENVSALVSQKFIGDFKLLNRLISELGYNVYWRVMDAADCGVPQQRKRLFAVYIHNSVDKGLMAFPGSVGCISLKEVLEPAVDDCYILSKDFWVTRLGQLQNRIDLTDWDLPVIVSSRGRNPEVSSDRRSGILLEQRLEPNARGICNTLTTVLKDNFVLERSNGLGSVNGYRLRKLTPVECFRLMGFTPDDVRKCQTAGVSQTALYTQAGNSIVTGCIRLLFEHLYKAQYDSTYKCSDE